MDVILAKDVEGLGKAGQTVSAKEGYARNFLFPNGLAFPATGAMKNQMQMLQAVQLKKSEALKQKAFETAAALEKISCAIPVTVGEQGKLYGSVTAADIAQALGESGIAVDKHQVLLEGPITQLGTHPVTIKLHTEVTATLQVSVVPK